MYEIMDKRSTGDFIETTIQKVREMIDANTIIGQPITTDDGITLIPVSKVTFGLAGGGSDISNKNDPKDGFGGGIGAGVNIVPVAFIVAKGESVRLLHVSPQTSSTVDKIIETVPEVLDFVSGFFSKESETE